MPQAGARQRAGAACGRSGGRAPDAGWAAAAARAAMSLFADILQEPQIAALKEELKWLTGELGPARELEVLVTRVVAPVKRRHSRLQGVSSLSRDFTQQRAAARPRPGCGAVGPLSRADARDRPLAGGGAVEEAARRPCPRSWRCPHRGFRGRPVDAPL